MSYNYLAVAIFKRVKKIIFLLFVILIFVSCDSNLRFTVIKQGGVVKGAHFSYSCKMPLDKDDIDTKALKESLIDSNIKNIHIKRNSTGLLVEGNFGVKDNPFINSGVVCWGEPHSDQGGNSSATVTNGGNDITLIFTRKTLRAFYEELPTELMAQVDLLMPPVTIDDTMSNEEYLDTLMTLYGEGTKSTVQNGIIDIYLGDKKQSIPIIKILNAGEENIINIK